MISGIVMCWRCHLKGSTAAAEAGACAPVAAWLGLGLGAWGEERCGVRGGA